MGVPPSAICSSSSYFCISSVLMYMERQIGQLVLRRTNHETRHSAWNSCPHTVSLRIVSGSGWVATGGATVVTFSVDSVWSVVAGSEEGIAAGVSLEIEEVGESFAGSGSDGP